MDINLLLRLAGSLIAILTFTISLVRWVNGELQKLEDKFERKFLNTVEIKTCELIHARTTKDVDRIEKSLSEGFKAIYEKFDRLNDTLNKIITRGE